MGIFSGLDALGKKDSSITGRYNIEQEILAEKLSNGSGPVDITRPVFTRDPSFETQVAVTGSKVALQGNEAADIASISTGDFHSNMFDIYFINPSGKAKNGLQDIFNNLFTGSEAENTYADLLQYAQTVTGYDSLCVRCAGIELPGYEIETKQFTHSGRIVQTRTNKVTSARNSSVSIRLDKNMVLLDLFSYMSGNNINYDMSNLQRVVSHTDVGGQNFSEMSDLDKAHYVGSFCNVWQRWGQSSDTPYDPSSLGLSIVVVIRPPKKKQYSAKGQSQLNRLNVEMTTIDGGDHRYSKTKLTEPFEEKYPIFIFENIKILGTSEVSLSNEPGDPPDITVDFIFRRFRKLFMTETELAKNTNSKNITFIPNSLGTSVPKTILDKSPPHGYPVPTDVKGLVINKAT